MNIWFTADTHFGHTNILKFDPRPFDSIEEHDEALIENWNSVVKAGDTVWHLGDFNFRSVKTTEWYRRQLNGNINLLRGNHDDKDAWKNLSSKNLFASTNEAAYIRWDHQKIYMLHYGCRVWRASHHGTWHLYGHSHGDLPSMGKSMDVGVMCHNYRPVSFDEIKVFMDEQPITDNHPRIQEGSS